MATISIDPKPAYRSRQDLSKDRQMLRAQVDEQRLFPGCALAVYQHGRLVLDLGEGFADTQAATFVDHQSLFPLFSGSKPLGAVALWQQIEAGRIGLDDRVADYWPAFGKRQG